MKKENEFLNYILELLDSLEGITVKSMFGGVGIFREGLMFAIVSSDNLYFKADEFNKFEFEHLNLKPFEYTKNGKKIYLSYYHAPEEVFDNSHDMVRWAELAFEAALRKKIK